MSRDFSDFLFQTSVTAHLSEAFRCLQGRHFGKTNGTARKNDAEVAGLPSGILSLAAVAAHAAAHVVKMAAVIAVLVCRAVLIPFRANPQAVSRQTAGKEL